MKFFLLQSLFSSVFVTLKLGKEHDNDNILRRLSTIFSLYEKEERKKTVSTPPTPSPLLFFAAPAYGPSMAESFSAHATTALWWPEYTRIASPDARAMSASETAAGAKLGSSASAFR